MNLFLRNYERMEGCGGTEKSLLPAENRSDEIEMFDREKSFTEG